MDSSLRHDSPAQHPHAGDTDGLATPAAGAGRSGDDAGRPASDVEVRAALELMPQLVWTTTADGYHDYYNERWHQYTGMPRPGDPDARAEGWNWKTYLHPDDYERTLGVWARCLATGEPYAVEYRFREHATGQYRWFLGRALPLRDADGRIVRWFGTCTDIHDATVAAEELRAARETLTAQAAALARANAQLQAQQVELEQAYGQLQEQQAELETSNQQLREQQVELEAQAAALHEANESLEMALTDAVHARASADAAREDLHAVFAQAPVAVCVTRGPDHVFTLVNAAYQRLLPGRALLGRPARAALADIDEATFQLLDRVYATGEPFVAHALAIPYDRTGTGQVEPAWFDLVYAPLRDGAGRVEGLVTVVTDVSEQVRVREGLEAARAEAVAARQVAETARTVAEAANQAKSEFLSTMSHELRTPLNAIGGYAELLSLGVRGPVTAEQREDLARIRRAGQHLQSLINDVLNYARLEAGHVHYALQDVSLDALVADVEALVSPQVAARGLTLAFHGCGAAGGPSHTVRADAEKVRQVLLNLLTNAIKFTAPGGRVTVTCEPAAGPASGVRLVRLHVSDTGRGIPAEAQARIFEPFVQVDRDLTQASQQGVGLGLAISRDLARGMGGDLTVESTEGVGSRFTLELPAA